MPNVEMLKKIAEESSGNIENFAREVGMNPATFYRKLQSLGNKFTVGEVHRMMDKANLSKETAASIFLN